MIEKQISSPINESLLGEIIALNELARQETHPGHVWNNSCERCNTIFLARQAAYTDLSVVLDHVRYLEDQLLKIRTERDEIIEQLTRW